MLRYCWTSLSVELHGRKHARERNSRGSSHNTTQSGRSISLDGWFVSSYCQSMYFLRINFSRRGKVRPLTMTSAKTSQLQSTCVQIEPFPMVVGLGHQANCSLQASSFWHSKRLGSEITMYVSKEVKIEVPTVQSAPLPWLHIQEKSPGG